MESKIKCLIKDKNHFIKVNIFGNTSKGVPGIEIIGIGNQGRFIKEKFVQISKELNMRIPPLKYILCVEINESMKLSKDDLANVELPLLITFWSLASQIPIKNLNDCLAFGKVTVDREIIIPDWGIPVEILNGPKKTKIISAFEVNSINEDEKIPLRDLFQDVGPFDFLSMSY